MSNKITRGDIFYIHKSKVCGCEQSAGRPAIVVSNDACNQTSEAVEVIYMTTRHKTMLPTHVTIKSSGKESTALCEQITTVSVDRIGDYYGHITEEEMEAVNEALSISLALRHPHEQEKSGNECSSEMTQQLTSALAERDVYKKLYQDLLDRLMKER